MENPWASAWDASAHLQEADITWSANTSQWPAAEGTVWHRGDARWDPSQVEQDITQDQRGTSQIPSPTVSEPPSATDISVQAVYSTSPPRDAFHPVPETSDAVPHNIALAPRPSDQGNLQVVLNSPDDEWSTAWGTAPSEPNPKETKPSDQWETARQEKEKLNRAVPPELLDSLVCHCQQVLQDVWPASENSNEDDRDLCCDEPADIAALLAQLLPVDSTIPSIVHFSATATAKAMNEALRLTRHLSASASSPLSRLLASKGSFGWENSIEVKQDVISDTSYVGWRVLEKEERLGAVEESKPRKTTGGLLSFWNRRASAIQPAPVEVPSEGAPVRSSLESARAISHSPPQVASPSRTSTPSMQSSSLPDPQSAAVPTLSTPSVVSRFLTRFSLTRAAQHNPLALSSDDLEYLSDIVPSASDPLDEDINGSALSSITSTSTLSPLPPKLPAPIPPPPKQPRPSAGPSSEIGIGTLDDMNVPGSTPTASQVQDVNHTPDVPVLTPSLSPRPSASFPRMQTHASSSRGTGTPTMAFGRSNTPSIQQRPHPGPGPNSQPHTSPIVPPSHKAPSSLPIPPLLPPPPVSPPQTPRPNVFPPITTPGYSSTTRNTGTSSPHDLDDSDDEFTAFSSFPTSHLRPSQRSPSPPSPPPRRTYDRTHYPNSSSTSSILSPASQKSADQLFSTRSSASASLDSFDDFVSSSSVLRGGHTPSPPPLPIKPQSQHWKSPRIDTLPSRAYHTHIPSQTFAPPTVHTSLVNSAFSVPPVSVAEHQRTRSLVDQAAARGGLLWPNSPATDEKEARAIPPPPSCSASPKLLIGDHNFDLLGNSNHLEALPSPPSMVGGDGINSTMSSPTANTLHASFGFAVGPAKELSSGNPPRLSPPLLPSTSTPILSFSSLAAPHPAIATNAGSVQSAKPKQMGGLSAQDLSFFEGL